MRLKELRKEKNLTQSEIANKLFITQNGYSSYENERTEPNIETLCKLADFYNVSLDYLVGREYSNDIGYLTSDQKNVVYVIKQLNEKNLAYILGQSLRLLNEQ